MLINFLFINYRGFESFSNDAGEYKWDRTWTTAICEGNSCRDFLVYCNDEEIIEMRPISGFVVFSDDWVDRRGKKEFCE